MRWIPVLLLAGCSSAPSHFDQTQRTVKMNLVVGSDGTQGANQGADPSQQPAPPPDATSVDSVFNNLDTNSTSAGAGAAGSSANATAANSGDVGTGPSDSTANGGTATAGPNGKTEGGSSTSGTSGTSSSAGGTASAGGSGTEGGQTASTGCAPKSGGDDDKDKDGDHKGDNLDDDTGCRTPCATGKERDDDGNEETASSAELAVCAQLQGVGADKIIQMGHAATANINSSSVVLIKLAGDRQHLDLTLNGAEGAHLGGICLFLAGNQAVADVTLGVHTGRLVYVGRGNQSDGDVTINGGLDFLAADLAGHMPKLDLHGPGSHPCKTATLHGDSPSFVCD